MKLGALYTERAVLQRRCQTEHARLIKLFMNDHRLADEQLLEGRMEEPSRLVQEPVRPPNSAAAHQPRPVIQREQEVFQIFCAKLASLDQVQDRSLLEKVSQMDTSAIISLVETPPSFLLSQFVEVFRRNDEEDVAEVEGHGKMVRQEEISSDSAVSASPDDADVAGLLQARALQPVEGMRRRQKNIFKKGCCCGVRQLWSTSQRCPISLYTAHTPG